MSAAWIKTRAHSSTGVTSDRSSSLGWSTCINAPFNAPMTAAEGAQRPVVNLASRHTAFVAQITLENQAACEVPMQKFKPGMIL
jgi:hypothetical protein